MKILLAVDGSPHTDKMLAYLGAHPSLFGSGNQFTALHVRPNLPGRAGSFVGKEAVEGYHGDEAAKVLGPVGERLEQAGLKAQGVWRIGPPGETIAQAAAEGGHELIVMGSHGHGALANLVMGSVATEVITGSRVPVLLVP